MEKTYRCSQCQGSGRVFSGVPLGSCDGPQYENCSACQGRGYITVEVEETKNDGEN
jgi:DnaJ-class molecular chaperone